MPQTFLEKLPLEQLQQRRALVRHWANTAKKIWSIIGDGKVGLVLLDRFWSGDDPWVSADYIQVELNGIYSEDTVRRRLRALIEENAILTRREGRLTLYAMRPSLAEEIVELMELPANCGKNPTLSRNLRDNLVVVGPYEDS